MKSFYLSILIGLISINLSAQNLTFFKNDFIKNTNKTLAILTEVEKKEQVVLLDSKIYIEYYTDSTSDEVNEYYSLMRRFHIHDAGALDSYNKIYLPISSNSEVVDLKVRSISPKGIVKELDKNAIKETTEDGQTYKMVAVEGLEPGFEMEFYYVIKTPLNIYGTELIMKQMPIRKWEFLIISPSFLKFEAKLYNTTGIKKDTIIDKIAFIGYEINNLAPQYDEKYSAGQANVNRIEYKLAYNTLNNKNKILTWKDAGNRFFEIMHTNTKNTAKELEKLLKKEKIIGLTEEASIVAIENYIKSNISIKEDAENMSPENILKSKFGEEGGITRLYVQLFEAANINYELIVGISRNKKKFDKTFETWNQLDKYYFYFPNNQKYLDPNNPMFRLGMIDASLEGTEALFISNVTLGEMKAGLTKIKTIPFSTNQVNFDNIDASITFSSNLENADIKYTRTVSGHQSGELKGYILLSNETQKKEILESILKSSLKEDTEFTNTQVKNYDINSEEVNLPLIINTDASNKSMIEKAGKKYIFKLGDIIGPQQELYNEHPRKQSIDIGNAHSYIRKIKVTIPEGYSVKGLEDIKRNITFNYESKKAMGFVSDYKQEGNVLTININEYYNVVLLPVEVYDDFEKVINAAADFNKVSLVFEK